MESHKYKICLQLEHSKSWLGSTEEEGSPCQEDFSWLDAIERIQAPDWHLYRFPLVPFSYEILQLFSYEDTGCIKVYYLLQITKAPFTNLSHL